MKERPILFSGPMVKAILDGRKTQTRRLVKSDHACYLSQPYTKIEPNGFSVPNSKLAGRVIFENPYGKPGDCLWVRETYLCEIPPDYLYDAEGLPHGKFPAYLQTASIVHYKATTDLKSLGKWKSPRFMPRWASRITLEIVNVRAERLQEISERDAFCEGLTCNKCGYTLKDRDEQMDHGRCGGDIVECFTQLWDSLYAKHQLQKPDPDCSGITASWESNPWVWVIEFRKIMESEQV